MLATKVASRSLFDVRLTNQRVLRKVHVVPGKCLDDVTAAASQDVDGVASLLDGVIPSLPSDPKRSLGRR